MNHYVGKGHAQLRHDIMTWGPNRKLAKLRCPSVGQLDLYQLNEHHMGYEFQGA
jgi:hypothetical protein